MSRTKRRQFLSILPATPCTPEMRDQVITIAESRGVSVAELQRDALSLFLGTNYSNAIEINSQSAILASQPQEAVS